MTPELWQRVSGIFHGAVAQVPTARAAFLDEQCAAEPELRAAVERLLVAHDKAGRFGETPIFSPGHAAQATGAAELAPAEDQVSSDGAGSGSAGPAVARRHVFFWVAALAA